MTETKIKESQISDLAHDFTVKDSGVTKSSSVTTLNFVGGIVASGSGTEITISGSSGTGGGSLEVQENDVQVVAEATVLNFEGDVEVTDDGDGVATVTVTASGAGGGGTPDFTWWNPYASPDSGSSYDDEFADEAGSGAPSGWTEYDVSSCLTVSETERGLTFVKSSTTQEIGGVYKTCPSSTDYTIYTKVDIQQYQTGDTQAGIFFIDNVNQPTTTDLEFWSVYIGSAGYGLRHATFSDYNSSSVENSQIHAPPIGVGIWLRVRVKYNVISYYCYYGYSLDGKSWLDVYNYEQDFAPNEFGLFIRSNQGANDVIVNFPFFRVDTSSGEVDSQLPANRVNGYLAT